MECKGPVLATRQSPRVLPRRGFSFPMNASFEICQSSATGRALCVCYWYSPAYYTLPKAGLPGPQLAPSRERRGFLFGGWRGRCHNAVPITPPPSDATAPALRLLNDTAVRVSPMCPKTNGETAWACREERSIRWQFGGSGRKWRPYGRDFSYCIHSTCHSRLSRAAV